MNNIDPHDEPTGGAGELSESLLEVTSGLHTGPASTPSVDAGATGESNVEVPQEGSGAVTGTSSTALPGSALYKLARVRERHFKARIIAE